MMMISANAFVTTAPLSIPSMVRQETGGQSSPDEDTCPSDFAIDDPRCVRAKDWAEIRSAAIDLQGLIGEKLVKINS